MAVPVLPTLLVLLACAAGAQGLVADDGCECAEACRTFFIVSSPRCLTKLDASGRGCGSRVPQIIASDKYWSPCSLNSSVVDVDRTLPQMWRGQFAGGVVVCAIANALTLLLGSYQLYRSKPKLILALAATVAVSLAHEMLIISILSFFIAEFYLTIPHALDTRVTLALGLAQGLFVSYMHVGRQYSAFVVDGDHTKWLLDD